MDFKSRIRGFVNDPAYESYLTTEKINFLKETAENDRLHEVLSYFGCVGSFIYHTIKCGSSSVTRDYTIPVMSAFVWEYSDEGRRFWSAVNNAYENEGDTLKDLIQDIKRSLRNKGYTVRGKDILDTEEAKTLLRKNDVIVKGSDLLTGDDVDIIIEMDNRVCIAERDSGNIVASFYAEAYIGPYVGRRA